MYIYIYAHVKHWNKINQIIKTSADLIVSPHTLKLSTAVQNTNM